MEILLALDSRVVNKAGFLVLNPHSGHYHFSQIDLAEDYNRLGFRGFTIVDDFIYVVNSAALYIFHYDKNGSCPVFRLHKTINRPEWELGDRASADLHDIHYSAKRDRLFIANSFMDCVDEISLDGQWLGRKYLWDISDEIMSLAKNRNPLTADLVHINHIDEVGGEILLTLGNLNGTRKGCVIKYDSGAKVIDDLDFPHDGKLLGGDFYISNSTTAQLYIYKNFNQSLATGRTKEDFSVPVGIKDSKWADDSQWIRGVALSTKYIIVGSTQLRGDVDVASSELIPPRLVFINRETLEHEGDLFLPSLEGFPNPCIYTVALLESSKSESVDFNYWPPPQFETEHSVIRKLLIPNSNFVSCTESGDKIVDWSWDSNGILVKHKYSDSGMSFNFDISSPVDKVYLTSGNEKANFVSPPLNEGDYIVPPDSEVVLTIPVLNISTFAKLQVFFMEFSDKEKTSVKSMRIGKGMNFLKTKTNSDTKSYKIAFRFSGVGTVTIGNLSLSVATK